MKFILQKTRKIGFLAFVLGVCLFYSQTAFSQATTKTWAGASGADWSVAGNWTPSGIPTSADIVDIGAGANVIVSGTANCGKLSITSAGTVGMVTVNMGGTLNVNNAATTINAAIVLNGGTLVNNGTMTVTGRQNLDAIRFDNPTSGTFSSTYMGTGILTCNTNATPTTTSGNSGTSMTFAQTSGGTATFTTSSSATYNFDVFVTSATGGTKSVFYCPKGNAIIDGNASITISGGKRAIRVFPGANNDAPNLTIGSSVTMTLSTTLTSTVIGMIYLDASTFTPTSASVTNKGTLNFSGDAGHPIYMTNATTGNSTNFTNDGTININGTFADVGSSGGIVTAGGNTTQGHVFTNSSTGAINFNTTGTTTKPLVYCSTSPKNTINNSGTITIGAGLPSLALAFRLGDSKSTFTNTGTLTVGAGSISGTTTNTNFNNNTGGILNLNSAVSSSLVIFTNTGGAFNVNATQRVGRLTFNSGTVAIADGTAFTVFLLTLTSVNIPLGTGNIILENPGGSISGGGPTAYIITNGTGTVTQTVLVAATSVTFPIGQSASSYDPVTIKPATVPVSFGARVGLQTTALSSSNDALVVNREWNITGTAGTTDLTFVSSALNKDGSSTRPSGAVGVVGHHNGTTWDADIAAVYTSMTNSWAVTGYTGSFSPFIVASPGVVLPTELLYMKAKAVNNTNMVSWETASEINNKGFDVQRKTQAGEWETLGFVNGSGKASSYTFEDKAPLSISYYRLRQVDFDGTETLSKVVSVNQSTKGRISITPNPTSDKVNINLNQNDVSNETATIVLSDMTGRQVLTQTTTAGAFQLDLSHLAKGMYVVIVQSNNAIYQEKIIRQ
jgi:hypothetical protein